MQFICHGVWRDLGEDGQQRMFEVFEKWSPPDGLKIHNRWVTPSGEDFVLAEAESVAILSEAVANWAPFIAYTIHPVAPAEEAVPRMMSAVSARAQSS